MRLHHYLVTSVTALTIGGCAAPLVTPEALSVPAVPLCFTLTEALEGKSAPLGLVNEQVMVRLERGAYVAVRENERGTYFRGPPGGIQFYNADPKQRIVPATLLTHDGGVFLPRDGSPAEPFIYIAHGSVPPVVPPVGASCATAAVVRDPASKEVRILDYAIVGGAAGATGGLAVYGAKSGSVGLGKSVGVGAASGLAAGAVIGAILQWESGKIKQHPPYPDPAFNARLAEAKREAQPVGAN